MREPEKIAYTDSRGELLPATSNRPTETVSWVDKTNPDRGAFAAIVVKLDDGRTRTLWRCKVQKTKKDARALLKAEQERRAPINWSDQSVEDWLKNYAELKLSVGEWVETYYLDNVAAFRRVGQDICPSTDTRLAVLRMCDVTLEDAKVLTARRPTDAKLVRRAFDQAVREGTISVNPFPRVRRSKHERRGRRDIVVLTEAQLDLACVHAKHEFGFYGKTFAAMILFAAWTAIRSGEVRAIRYCDIDPVNYKLQITRQFNRAGRMSLPKSRRPRTVTCPPQALDALRDLLPVDVDALIESGSEEVIFRTQKGCLFSERRLTALWMRVRRAANLPLNPKGEEMEFHELRHFGATMLVEKYRQAGLPPDAADIALQLGHEDGGILAAELYIHDDHERAHERRLRAYRADRSAEPPRRHLKLLPDLEASERRAESA
jgi:integrase